MTSKEFEKLISSYKAEYKKSGKERPLTNEEFNSIGSSLENIPDDYKRYFDMAHDGNFSKFEKLPLLLRNFLGESQIRLFHQKFGENPSLENPDVQQYLKDNAMNAALRAGISSYKNSNDPAEREMANTCDKIFNKSILEKTLMPPTESEIHDFTQTVGEDAAPAELNRNLARQRVMAKMLLMGQLGRYDISDAGKAKGELTEPLSETLAHGGRTNIVLPTGEDSKQIFNAFLGENKGREAGVYKRLAATHYVSRREVGAGGSIANETEEQKPYFFQLHQILTNQYGMNLATGGIGSKGPDGNVIKGHGELGHAYMRLEKGDKTHCGAIMFGIEGCEPGVTNSLGHVHDIRAKSAKQSAFLADKGVVGNKKGGRQIDLSGISTQELVGILNEFDDKYSELQNNANTPEGRKKLAAINDMLMGKPMEPEKLIGMFNELNIGGNEISNIVNKARKGFVNGLNAKDISKEDFEQSIRATYNQKDACKLAKERFECSGQDITLAVGAIKELMYTHKARGPWFKIRHPFQNYSENKTIASLTKKLEKEKNFSRTDILKEMSVLNDTFKMDWGKEHSNPADIVGFIRDNQKNFLPSENKLKDVINEACKDISKKAKSDYTITVELPEKENVQEQKQVDPSFREHITVEIEKTSSKEKVSERILDNQPNVERGRQIG